MKLKQFQFECITDNFGAMSLYKKMGFKKKRIFSKFKKDGITYDQVFCGTKRILALKSMQEDNNLLKEVDSILKELFQFVEV